MSKILKPKPKKTLPIAPVGECSMPKVNLGYGRDFGEGYERIFGKRDLPNERTTTRTVEINPIPGWQTVPRVFEQGERS